jgi:hypothetical protein
MKSIISLQSSNFLKDTCTFFLYFIFFLALFFQFPHHGSLPSHWDTWLHLSLYNYYWDYFKSLFNHQEIYYAMWPSQVPYFRYGEMSLLSAVLYWPFKWIIKDDLWAYYLHISSIYALVSFSMYKLSSLFVSKKYLAILGGLLLTTSNYYLASIDQVNVISAYPSILCIYFLIKWTRSHPPNTLFIASIFYGLQIYASGYLFFYLNIALTIIALFNWSYLISTEYLKRILVAGIIGIVIIFPYLYFYLFKSQEPFCFNAGRNIDIVSALSIKWDYFSNSLPYNILYGNRLDRTLLENIKSINLGFIFPMIAFCSLIFLPTSKEKKIWWSLLILFLLLGIGPIIKILNFNFPSPIYNWILKPLHIDKFLRTPVRAFIPILIILVLLVIKFLEKINKRSIIILIILGILIENIPYKFQYFDSKKYLSVPDILLTFTQSIPKNNILLIAPTSKMTEKKLNINLGEVNREYIYMYWQTKLKKTMINGSNGFVPYSSMSIYKSINKSPIEKDEIRIKKKMVNILYLPLMNIE